MMLEYVNHMEKARPWEGETVRVLKLGPPSGMDINPFCVGLVVHGNLIEVNGFGKAFPEARVSDSHG